MKKLALLAILAGTLSTGPVSAQSSEPTYKADPDVYKLIFEDVNFRVIVGTRKPGQKDKAHAAPGGRNRVQRERLQEPAL